MKVRVVKDHLGEGLFPTFSKGTAVMLKDECANFLYWYSCEIENHQTYVPIAFVFEDRLTRDYNPTELTQRTGDIVEVHEIVCSWLYATNESGKTGWIPAEIVVSIE